jgi:hypothetical protein
MAAPRTFGPFVRSQTISRQTPYMANAPIQAVHKRPVQGVRQSSASSIAAATGASACKRTDSAQCPFASANSARVSPQRGQSRPVSQWNGHNRHRGSAGNVTP